MPVIWFRLIAPPDVETNGPVGGGTVIAHRKQGKGAVGCAHSPHLVANLAVSFLSDQVQRPALLERLCSDRWGGAPTAPVAPPRAARRTAAKSGSTPGRARTIGKLHERHSDHHHRPDPCSRRPDFPQGFCRTGRLDGSALCQPSARRRLPPDHVGRQQLPRRTKPRGGDQGRAGPGRPDHRDRRPVRARPHQITVTPGCPGAVQSGPPSPLRPAG